MVSTKPESTSTGGLGELSRILAEDWRYQATALERSVIITYRIRHWGIVRRPRWAWRCLALALKPAENLLRLCYSGQISATATIGRRVRIVHAWGIVIHPNSVIGDDCTICHQVTLGVNEHQGCIAPRLGNSVYVGVGAKIIGPVTIGDGAVVGAGAVVVKHVPEKHIAVGVPAASRLRP